MTQHTVPRRVQTKTTSTSAKKPNTMSPRFAFSIRSAHDARPSQDVARVIEIDPAFPEYSFAL